MLRIGPKCERASKQASRNDADLASPEAREWRGEVLGAVDSREILFGEMVSEEGYVSCPFELCDRGAQSCRSPDTLAEWLIGAADGNPAWRRVVLSMRGSVTGEDDPTVFDRQNLRRNVDLHAQLLLRSACCGFDGV